MTWIARYLWIIPVLPLVAAGLTAVARSPRRKLAAALAIGSMAIAVLLSAFAFAAAVSHAHAADHSPQIFNFRWFQIGETWLRLGWVLDPLSAVMLLMVSFVGLLIFIYSVGYMAHDENFTRFFCFLSLFAAAMMGVVIANSLLLLFICWELVGLASYLLIGFWYHKPSAAAAARKAFVTTRIGDLAFLLGMVWLYSRAGTLLFYDQGAGCIEQGALSGLIAHTTRLGVTSATGIALLIFLGAMGKSGQVPLHVWLPDAMEGPTPVSALIHAATMVAAGVFLVARVFPLMALSAHGHPGTALQVVTWVGAITAVFAASIAVAQTDIKRILAYSTVSQLGYMMLGLGVGGIAVGMFHLLTHAFFKALLFLGAGSVIHGCHQEQDIRCMGGLRKLMPVTFATFAVGMLALSGFPLLFSGFWSKDEILHAAHAWPLSHWPFYLGVFGALLTAFYMTRQVIYVFFGNCRLGLARTASSESTAVSEQRTVEHAGVPAKQHPQVELPRTAHESPAVMTVPLAILALFSILLGVIGTPAWPWLQTFLGRAPVAEPGTAGGLALVMALSTVVVLAGIGIGYWLYGRNEAAQSGEADVLERSWPATFALLRNKFYFDEIYDVSVVRLNAWAARTCDWLDRTLIAGLVRVCSYLAVGLGWLDRFLDEYVINLGFDAICRRLTRGGARMSGLQTGQVQSYLRVIGFGLIVLVLFLVLGWGVS